MSNPFIAKPENIGNVYKDIIDGDTYVMVSPKYNHFAMVSLFGSRRWQSSIEGGEVFVHKTAGELELEYIGKIDRMIVKRTITQTEEVTK